MHVCIGSCVSKLFVIIVGEKCLLKSLHSCGPVIFFEFQGNCRDRSKTTFQSAQQRKSSIIGGSSLKHLEATSYYSASELELTTVVSVLPHSVDRMP